jgi:hypothetical protein
MIADIAIVAGILLWDLAILRVIWHYSRPSWRRKPKVPKALKTRITFDRDEWGDIL